MVLENKSRVFTDGLNRYRTESYKAVLNAEKPEARYSRGAGWPILQHSKTIQRISNIITRRISGFQICATKKRE